MPRNPDTGSDHTETDGDQAVHEYLTWRKRHMTTVTSDGGRAVTAIPAQREGAARSC